jgi:hypothetical protein
MLPSEVFSKNVLISPLNWGMGHVARCIPLIDQLLKQQNLIFIACNESQQEIFEFYFKNQKVIYIDHKGYPFRFNGKGRFWLDMLIDSVRLSKRKSYELLEVDALVDLHEIDIIISDHRYGFFSQKCKSVFMTHQLNLPVKGVFKIVQKLHEKELRKFHFIWVLDDEKSTFSGNLSRNYGKFEVHYIGLLSRFSLYEKIDKVFQNVVIVSGPEPYAEQFFLEQLSISKALSLQTIIISPKFYGSAIEESKIRVLCSENWLEKDEVILRAKKITSRSGYSTIMDIQELKSDFEFIPTKGQSEQIYLSKLHQK